MFNFRRVLRFWRAVLVWVLPLYALLVVLAFVALAAGQRFTTPAMLPIGLALALVPAVLGIGGAFAVAVAYMQKLYALNSTREVFFYLVHCMFGQAQFRPWMLLEEGAINFKWVSPDSLIARLGGPGHLVIRKDTAIVLEQGGRLTRVEGPGFPRLAPMERVYGTVDLRPQRSVHSMNALSKEGIELTCTADIEYQISSGGQTPTGDNPFPMERAAVFAAATGNWIREENRPAAEQVINWTGQVVLAAMDGTLRFILARYPLDLLIGPERAGQDHPRDAICRELEAELVAFAPTVGARILKVELGDIRVADEVTQQRIEKWRADWHRWETEVLARAEAHYIETVGDAQSEVVVRRIRDIANTLAGLATQGRKALVAGTMLELYRSMGKMDADSLAMTYLPREAMMILQSATGLPPLLQADAGPGNALPEGGAPNRPSPGPQDSQAVH